MTGAAITTLKKHIKLYCDGPIFRPQISYGGRAGNRSEALDDAQQKNRQKTAERH
jgi:hypothetical protein